MNLKTEDLIKMNAAANGRLIVGMLFALNLVVDHRGMALAAVLIVCIAYLSDAMLVNWPAWAEALAGAALISTLALAIATWAAL